MPGIANGASGILSRKVENFDELAVWVKEAIRREQMRYRDIWLQWLRNILAFHGEDNKQLTDQLTIQKRISPADQKALDQVNMNFILPHVRTMVAKLKRAKPILECDPASSDDDDILAAKCGDKLLKGEWFQQNLDTVDTEHFVWQALTGSAILHQFFDPTKGEQVGEGIFQGQVRTVCSDPFKTFLEPLRRHDTDCRWVIFRERLPRDEILERYEEGYFKRTGQQLGLGIGESVKTDDIADAYLEVAGVRGSGIDDSDYRDVDTLYHLPTKWYPSGRYAIICGTEVLYEGPYPYPFLGRLPILMFKEVLCPWRLHGETGTSEVLRIQNLYNRLRKIEKDYHLDNLAAKWMLKRGTTVKMASLRSRETSVIHYDGEKAPERANGLNIPNGIYNSLDVCRQELARSGLSDETHSSAGPNESGRAIALIQEQDDLRLGLTAIDAEPVYARWGQNDLLMVRHFYTEKRRYKMVGEANAGGLWFFDKADLGQTSDVRCQTGTALPMSKLARREAVKEDLAMGILGPEGAPETITRARKMLGEGLTDDVQADVTASEYVSERENLIMGQTGQIMPVSQKVDNHLLHIKSHVRKANAPGIRDVPEKLAVFEAHIGMHEMAMNPMPMMLGPDGQPMAPAPGMPMPGAPGMQVPGPQGAPPPGMAPAMEGPVVTPSNQNRTGPNDAGPADFGKGSA